MQPETRKLGNHPVPFPLELPKRVMKLYSYPNDLIMDPFMGVGTTALAAQSYGRRFIGIDMDKKYVDYSMRRLRGEKMNNMEFEDEE
jgi:DNA modification methylase